MRGTHAGASALTSTYPEHVPSSSAPATIRLGDHHDLPALTALSIGIQAFHVEGRPDLFREPDGDALRAFLASRIDSEDVMLVAEVEERIVGYLLGELVSSPETPFRFASSHLYVHHIAITPQSQRQGVGRELLREAEMWARSQNARAIRLDSWAFNSRAHDFFKSEGFAPLNTTFEKELRT